MKKYIQPQSMAYTVELEQVLAASADRTVTVDSSQNIADIYSEDKDSWNTELWSEE